MISSFMLTRRSACANLFNPDRRQLRSSSTLRSRIMTGLVLSLTLLTWPVQAQTATKHIHGQAELNIAIERNSVTLMLVSPLENLVGFEHAPRNAKEQAEIDRAQQALKQGDRLFELDNAGRCEAQHIESPRLFNPSTDRHDHSHGHHHRAAADTHKDAELTLEYACASVENMQFVDVKALFKTFPRLETLQVQMAGPEGQSGMTVKSDRTRIPLSK